jgi:hypothetical protein
MKVESSQANHGVLRTIFYRLQHFSDGVSECFYTTVHYADTKGNPRVWPSFVAALGETQVILEHREEIS